MALTRAEIIAEHRAMLKAASEASAKLANELADPLLDSIHQQADELSGIFSKLQLTDPETYDKLKRIVNNETKKNIAIASIVQKVKDLGEKGESLAKGISKLTGAGALAALGSALGKRR